MPTFKSAENLGADESGRISLVRGVIFLSAGLTVMAISLAYDRPGATFTVRYGTLIVGALLFLRGLYRWWTAAPTPFPVVHLIFAALLPLFVGFGALQLAANEKRSRADAADETRRAAEVDEQARKQELRQRTADRERKEVFDKIWTGLRSGELVTTRCFAANELVRLKIREVISDLYTMARHDPDPQGRACAIDGLVAFEQTDSLLDVLGENARSADPKMRTVAAAGFRKVGERAAPVAMRFLAEWVKSPDPAVRYEAIDTLGAMGAAGEPLLREAIYDTTTVNRDYALKLLAALKTR